MPFIENSRALKVFFEKSAKSKNVEETTIILSLLDYLEYTEKNEKNN